MPCAEAKDGEPLLTGRIYLAPGDKHLIIERDRAPSRGGSRSEPGGNSRDNSAALSIGLPGGLAARARLSSEPPENFCRPSVDPMLRSATAVCDGRVLVAMLTGMGHDGLAGTRCAVEAGGAAIAQDEATSVVWGMPGSAAHAGICAAILPLNQIAPKLVRLFAGDRS